MGAAAADYDGDGLPDIFRTNFSDERETLYQNAGGGHFNESTMKAGLAHNTRFVGWGTAFLDFDNDGWRDLFLANGHVFPEVDSLKTDIRYKERAILYRNLGTGAFEDVSERAGPGVAERHSARGAAVADLDNDGSLEILIGNQNEPPSLLRNAAKPRGAWLSLRLLTRTGRDAIGAEVEVSADGRRQLDEVRSGGSYLSQNSLRLHFGLGPSATARVKVRWPDGGETVHPRVSAGRQTLRQP